ncbi:hypothetical protein [Klebsiella variicola]|uniref:hypothetical protein n=1 Tax=Klebsiella variicola TaxID=244366 RepID=UPI0028A52BFF|nr:hypothetical protein [Klebsiella pneumoniae]
MADNEKLGSTSPEVLLKNVVILDKLVSDKESESLPDRFGVPRISWHGMEQDFNRQMTDHESSFEAAQTDKENRFQQFLNTSGYVFLGDYQDGPFQFSARNQYIRYNGQYYRLNAATDVGFTTTGITAASFANDVSHFVLMDGDTLRQNMAAGDGLKYIGQCANYTELRTKTPEYDGQKIYVRSSVTFEQPGEFPSAPMTFIYLSGCKLADYPDDGGTCIATADGVNVWINEAILRENIIDVRWFGAKNNYTSDSSAAIQKAHNAAEFWALRVFGETRGPLGHRWIVKYPQKWKASRTITYNPVCSEIFFNNGTGIFVSGGQYIPHPNDQAASMLFEWRCEKPAGPGSDLYIPAYNSFGLARHGTVLFGRVENGQPFAASIYNSVPTEKMIMFGHYGITEVLYTALGEIEEVTVAGCYAAYVNGDYAWGVRFNGVKFENNYYFMELRKLIDNGERFDFVNCKSLNNAKAIKYNDWAGQINWGGGSLDYFKMPNPFEWDEEAKAILIMNNPHFEFNPYTTACMFDLSKAHLTANVTIRDGFMVLANPSPEDGGGIINDALIKRRYPENVVVDNLKIVDVSASGRFTKNYLLFEDQPMPALITNINPVTLKDYLVATPFLNRQRITKWQFYFSGSNDFIPSVTDSSVSITGAPGAKAGEDKSVFLFIPAAEIKSSVQFLLGMLTCNRCDINAAFALWTGYSKSTLAGMVSAADIVIDQPVGAEQLVTLRVGRNTSVTAYAGGEVTQGGYTLADWTRPLSDKPAEGLIIRIWLFNQGAGDTVTLSVNSGLITL